MVHGFIQHLLWIFPRRTRLSLRQLLDNFFAANYFWNLTRKNPVGP
jgi:hypothetical protein